MRGFCATRKLPFSCGVRTDRATRAHPVAQYGSRLLPKSDAETLLRDLDKLAVWAEEELGRLP